MSFFYAFLHCFVPQLLTCYCSLNAYGLVILSGQNQSIYVILKKRGLSLSKYHILVPAFVLSILINLYESFSVPKSAYLLLTFTLLEMLTQIYLKIPRRCYDSFPDSPRESLSGPTL